MFEDRDPKSDLLALALLALTVFLALTLLTYDPADPPNRLVFPAAERAGNACGWIGAWTAWLSFNALGVGAYYLLASLGVLTAWLLGNRPVNQRWIRSAGWTMSLVGVCTLAAMATPGLSPGPVIGAGGYLGAAGGALLEMHFATAGAYVLVLCLTAAGLLLCTDYVLLRLSALLLGPPTRQMGRGLSKMPYFHRGRGRRSASAEVEADNDDLSVSIRIGGKKPLGEPADEVDDDEDDEDDDELDEEGDALDGAAEALPGETAAATGGAGLRVRTQASKRDERAAMMLQLDEASQTDDGSEYELPPIEMLLESEPVSLEEHEKEVRRKAKVLEKTFANFGFNVKVVEIETGPVIAQFEVELEAGLRLSKITGLADDLAIALRVPSVRIVAPIPGKNTVGIEVPNEERQLVRLREVIEEANGRVQKMRVPLFLGKDVAGNPMVADLSSLPHLLIAGRTGTGKSVCLNTIITSILMTRRPDEVRMLLIDPKMVELSPYKTLPHLMHPVVTDMRKAEAILAWAVEKMEERYALLARAGVRHISGYNLLGEAELMERLQPESDEERKNIPLNLPYIVIVADEMADLMMTAAKEVETHIIRLAQKSRAVGIHLVLATQKPTVDVITGLIKSNLPARICFQVASRTDSRVVLDEMGADKLLGNGDMLFLWPGTSTLIRGQGTYVSDEEINRVVEFVGTSEPQFVKELVQLKASGSPDGADRFKHRDDLYEAAIDVVVREGRGSVSLLQRALGIGYGRGARLIDFMAEDGFVGAYNGSQAREVLISLEQWEEMRSQDAAPAAAGKRSNRILPDPPDEEDHAVQGRARKARSTGGHDDDDPPPDMDDSMDDSMDDDPDEEADEEADDWNDDESEVPWDERAEDDDDTGDWSREPHEQVETDAEDAPTDDGIRRTLRRRRRRRRKTA